MRAPHEVSRLMNLINQDWRFRWCENRLCGCLGAANCVGAIALRVKGESPLTKEEWQEWMRQQPARTE